MADEISKEQQVGIHKGSLSVLAKEREEFIKLLNVVEQLMQAHIKALKDLGVDLEAEAKKAQEMMKKTPEVNENKTELDERLS
ncbi:MAG: hypothetical protein U9Q69_02470 [Nanoarchaeota archaeon]|nr:hypothetical protein [Nanoarchaeota archaeon]